MKLTQVDGVRKLFDINFGCIYRSLYSVNGICISFGGFDQYCK